MKHWLYGCVFISSSLPRKGYRLADALSCALLRKYSARRSFMVVLLLSRMAFVWRNNFEPSRRAIWRNAKNTTIARPSESCLYSFDKWKTGNDGRTIFRRFVTDVRCKTCYSNFWTRMSHIFPMEGAHMNRKNRHFCSCRRIWLTNAPFSRLKGKRWSP